MVSPVHKALPVVLLLGLSCATTPPVLSLGPEPEVRLLDDQVVPWPSVLAPQRTTLVVFATPWCEICRRERPEVEAWARAHSDPKRTVYVFSGGPLPGLEEQVRAIDIDRTALTVVVDADGRLADRYKVQATPTLLVLGDQGRVLSTSHRFESVHLE